MSYQYAPASGLVSTRARRSPRELLGALTRRRPELGLLLVLAAVLNLWALQRNGLANEYYGAAVRSMTSSWHNFLFASFDPSGVMTTDKPPLALWVQALSARIFGVHPLSVLVPQALMGMAAVALLYDLTRRRFGRFAGFIAGLVLATTPMTVAVSRHNNPDALLMLCCVAALWFIVRALEDGRTRWLVLAGVSVGLGFEAKMGAALLVVPALAAAWLWVAPRGRRTAVGQLLAGGGAMVAVGGGWPLLVWLTPASQRPWISGTSDNNIWSLSFGYNGLGRLDGQAGGPPGAGGGPGGGPGRGGGGGGGFFGGDAGPLRLLNDALGSQAGWFLGFAIVAALALLLASRLRRLDPRSGWLIAVGGAFLTCAGAFSTAQGIFHPYYVSQLAPFTAGLVGAGAAHFIGSDRPTRLFALLAVAAGLACELAVLPSGEGLDWLPWVLGGVGLFAAWCLVRTERNRRLRTGVIAVLLATLLIAPASWAFETLGHATNGTFPSGGPSSAAGFGGPGGNPFGGDSTELRQAISYARAHGGGTVATASQSGAASQVIASGARVAGIGGFSGRESEVSVSWLADAVRSGRIRWVLTSARGGPGAGLPRDGRVGASKVMSAVTQVCVAVKLPTAASSSQTTSAGQATASGGFYDCAGRAHALAAAAAPAG